MTKGQLNNIESGPLIYLNWLAANKGQKIIRTCEYPLFTDAHIIGELTEGYGPYKFINPVPLDHKPGLIQTGIVLRIGYYFEGGNPDLSKTNTEFYHGGGLTDEIAALSSLALGIRLKSGDLIRSFEPHTDTFGRPYAYNLQANPILVVSHRHRGLRLPRVVGSRSLIELTPLSALLTIPVKNITALLKAARLYQDALWIAESEPALSWIMLVSALETGAAQWRKDSQSPIDRLEVSKPRLVELLRETGIPELPEKVATLIADSLGATKKFIDFVIKFMPNVPEKRPPEWIQLDWSESSMRNTLSKIYDYRSKALHGGTPFPGPMCEPPVYLDKTWVAYSERPLGLAAGMAGGTWVKEDMPLLLHTFEYIARGTLLNWWKSIALCSLYNIRSS